MFHNDDFMTIFNELPSKVTELNVYCDDLEPSTLINMLHNNKQILSVEFDLCDKICCDSQICDEIDQILSLRNSVINNNNNNNNNNWFVVRWLGNDAQEEAEERSSVCIELIVFFFFAALFWTNFVKLMSCVRSVLKSVVQHAQFQQTTTFTHNTHSVVVLCMCHTAASYIANMIDSLETILKHVNKKENTRHMKINSHQAVHITSTQSAWQIK